MRIIMLLVLVGCTALEDDIPRRRRLHTGWRVCRATGSACGDASWAAPPLPTTALGALLAANDSSLFATPPLLRDGELDPYYSTNLDAIRDISDTGPEFYTLRYEIRVSSGVFEVSGLNYRATVDVDGTVVEPLQDFGGLWSRRSYVVDEGLLGVTIQPPDHPGNRTCPTVSTGPCGQGGDHSLAMDVTSQFLLGWDWMRAVPDRSTGFLGKVELIDPGVEIRDAAVLTVSLGCDGPCSRVAQSADVRVLATIRGVTQNATVTAQFPSLGVEADSVVAAGEVKIDATLTDIPLWWPRGMSSSDENRSAMLQPCVIEVRSGGLIVARKSLYVGFRLFESVAVDERTGGRSFSVNGRPLFLIGGNWITPDAMFQYSADAQRYRAEVELHAAAGLNALRVWGGGISERDEFYQACDEVGMVVYQEFWMSGDNNGRWAGNYSWPLDGRAYAAAVADTTRRLRRFASLFLYGGGNELWPASLSPPSFAMTAITNALDEGTQALFIPSSMDGGRLGGNESDHNDSYALAPKDGPYSMLLPEAFGMRNPGLPADLVISISPEVGSAGVPRTPEQLLLFVNDTFPSANGSGVGEDWTYHNFEPLRSTFDNATYDFAYAFARDDFESLDDWLSAANLALVQQNQLLYESFSSRIFDWYAGMFMWKSQSPWPALRGYLYDWYGLDFNGAWTGARAANVPLRKLQFDFHEWAIHVVNRDAFEPWNVSRLDYEWFDASGHDYLSGDMFVDAVPPAASTYVTDTFPPIQPSACGVVCFLRLTAHSDSAPVSTLYWRSAVSPPDYAELGDLRSRSAARASLALKSCVQTSSRALVVQAELVVSPDSPDLLLYPQLALRLNESVAWSPYVGIPGGDTPLFVLPGGNATPTITVSPACDGTNTRLCPSHSKPASIELRAWNLPAPITLPISCL